MGGIPATRIGVLHVACRVPAAPDFTGRQVVRFRVRGDPRWLHRAAGMDRGLAQGVPTPSLLAIERAYYAGERAAGREALEALGEADDVTRAWALWRVAGMHRIRGVDRQTKRRHERVRKPLLEEAESLMKARIEADPNDAAAHLVLSQVYQARITGMMSGMRFGRRAGETLDRALELAPDDPRPLYLKGVNQLMAPGPFGNKEEARRNLEAAVARFAEGAPEGAFWWGEPEAHAFLGLSYARENEHDQARAAYERALELEPGFAWVRESLLPDLESQ